MQNRESHSRALADYPRAEAENVGVVVLAGEPRRETFRAACRAYALEFVRRQRHSYARAADQYAQISLAAEHLFANRRRRVRVIALLACRAAHVDALYALRL